MATRGRPPGQGKVPGSGRVKGKSIDRGERQLVTSQLAGDIMAVYESLGGVDWLLKWAKANPKEFIQQGLGRLFPAAQRDDPDAVNNTQNNYYNLSPLEAARRVAFALNAGIHAQAGQLLERDPALIEVTGRTPAPEPVEQPEMSPQEACRWGAPDQPNPSPEPEGLDQDRQRWAAGLSMTAEQRRDAAVVRETRECSIETYRGSSAEQHDAPRRPSSCRPSPGERCRALSRRGRDLL